MDRLSRLRSEAGSASDVSGGSDTGFHTADNTASGSTKYFSFTDDESSTPKKSDKPGDLALSESTPRPATADAGFGAGLSPITQNEDIDYNMGGEIDARNILSGGVDIFDDYNSNDGDGLVIDDEANVSEDAESGADDRMSRCTEKVICEPIESANLSLSADATLTLKEISESQMVDVSGGELKTDEAGNNEVILQIDGRDVDALDIGNGLYLYRKEEGEELNALQILHEEGQAPHFKFLKVRQIGDSNLEVYEEHITEVPMTNEELEEQKRKEKEEEEIDASQQKTPHLPITDLKKALNENSASGKTVALNAKINIKEDNSLKLEASVEVKSKLAYSEKKQEVNSDSKLKPLKNLEGSRKSPILGNFTSMTLHSSTNREGASTKTMINLPLNSNRNVDTVKKTIEVSTDNSNLKSNEKMTVGSLLPAKIEGSNVIPSKELKDTKKEENICKNSETKEKNISDIKVGTDKPALDKDNDENFMSFDNESEGEASVRPKQEIVNNNANLLSKNYTDSNKDVKDIADAQKATDHRSIFNKQMDMKKESQSNKTANVISKWVLRSDSVEEKCKKEKDKALVEVKPLNSYNNRITSSDISVKNSVRDVELKYKKTELLNVGVPKDNAKDETKDSKDRISKPVFETRPMLKNVPKCAIGESSNTTPTLITEDKSQKCNLDHKDVDPHIILKGTTTSKSNLVQDEKILKNEKANNFEFVNKYISEAFKNVPSRPTAIPPPSGTKKSDIDNKSKVKLLNKVPVSTVKTTNYDSPLRIDVETSSSTKPVPFGKWTEGDKQEYLNKLKDQKVPSTNSSLSPVKNYQLASAKNDMKRLELKKKADTFERAHLSNLSLPPQPEEKAKPLRDVDMKGLIDKTIEGMILETLLGSAGKPPTINPPKIATTESENKDLLDDVEKRMKEIHGITQNPKEQQTTNLQDGPIESTSKLSEKSVLKTEALTAHSKAPSIIKSSTMPRLLPLHNSNSNKVQVKPLETSSVLIKSNDDEDSEEEIIDSQPVTGDMQWPTQHTKDSQKVTIAAIQKMIEADKVNANISSKPLPIEKKAGITEVEFDKFVRRNSTSHCMSTSSTSEIKNLKAQGSIQRPIVCEKNSKQIQLFNQNTVDQTLSVNMSVSEPQKPLVVRSDIPQAVHSIKPIKERGDTSTTHSVQETGSNINYHTKLQMAYQMALSAKSQKEPRVKNIENNPVKVTYATAYAEVTPSTQNLSSTKKDNVAVSTSTALEKASSVDVEKTSEQTVVKPKHPRKQVLTPVDSPLIEIIQPSSQDEVAHKKRRKTDHKPSLSEPEFQKSESKDFKVIAPKKQYLLGRTTSGIEETKKDDVKVTASEKIYEKSSKTEYLDKIEEPIIEAQTPKRGRGRPRKNPIKNTPEPIKIDESPKTSKLSEGDSQENNSVATSNTEEDDSDEEGIIRENWTMGKIDEKIVCPICTKLFRSENIVFKHVKHCSALLKSPTKRTSNSLNPTSSPKKGRTENIQHRQSQNEDLENESDSDEPLKSLQIAKKGLNGQTPIKAKTDKNDDFILLDTPSPNKVIVIEDTPLLVVDKPVKLQEPSGKSKLVKPLDSRQIINKPVSEEKVSGKSKLTKTLDDKTEPAAYQKQMRKVGRPRSTTQHTCEICGKTFRQISYLVHHRTVHNKDIPKNRSNDSIVTDNKPILSCETCGKDFRKLHHLVEHREIHNISASNTNLQRKFSVDRMEQKKDAEPSTSMVSPKKPDDHPAGFRCEPCDKSFRKLHHLVEHRETHDGANRLKNSPPQVAQIEKPVTESPTCEICGKSFRKLHHLIEHRETHNESQLEKKERKLSLLAKDIIHECSLCYMVFPNEPSLNKHFGICQKKKKAPASTAPATDESKLEVQPAKPSEVEESQPDEKYVEFIKTETAKVDPETVPPPAAVALTTKRNSKEIIKEAVSDIPEKMQKLDSEGPKTPKNPKPTKIGGTSKIGKFGGNTITKPSRIGATITKRSRSSLSPLPEDERMELKFKESDDEVRYMINPSYRPDSDEEKEIFMNICVTKRNSLQLDNPSAKDEFKRRRTSLQHHPKIQRAGSKKVEKLSKPPNVPNDEESTALKAKLIKNKRSSSTVPSNSLLAEDSEVKYSFPKTAKTLKPPMKSGIPAPKTQITKVILDERTRKVEKRKSLTGIAKRKSFGKSAIMKPTSNVSKDGPTTSTLKKETKTQIRHVCDCGKPFSSATLLAQHAVVAHTPPRIRRPRTELPATARTKQKLAKHSGVPVALKPLRGIDK